MSDTKLYVVIGYHTSMKVTYNCPTAELALKKLRDFVHSEYTGIVVTGPDGRVLAEADLIALVEGAPAGGAPVDVDALNGLALVALA